MLEKEKSVLVVPRNELFPNGSPQGFFSDNIDEIIGKINENHTFAPRPLAENDPSLKQIIPYAVVTHNDKIFTLARLNTQDETRLHDKISIGVGGHINPEPTTNSNILETGLERELNEELNIPNPISARIVGFINDDSNPVGQVHLGIVFHVQTDSPDVSVRENDLMKGQFHPQKDVAKMKHKMESWSQLLVENMHILNLKNFSPIG